MTFDKVKEVFVETINCNEEDVKLEAKLAEDLGMDSLDAVEVVMALEEAFEISIEEDKVSTFETVQDIVNYIDSIAA